MFSGLVGSLLQVKTGLLGGFRRREGQGMVEYALILVMVSLTVIILLLSMGRQIKNNFSNIVLALGS